MTIDPTVPLFGLILIAANILLAAARPFAPPALMGLQLFTGGLFTLMISVVDLVNPLGIAPTERLIAFMAGTLNCAAGYYMVLESVPFVKGIRRMLTTIMGAAIFSVGFFMLILGLLDLLRLSGLTFGIGERVLLYVGGILLCVLGYMMARRLPRAPVVEPVLPESDLTNLQVPEQPADQV